MKRPTEADLDAFVSGSAAPTAPVATPSPIATTPASEETKRLTLDIPKSLHRAFKLACAERDVSMVEDITTYIRSRCAKGGAA